jgi:integrase
MKKCDANQKKCEANHRKNTGANSDRGTNLWLRNGTFYFITELPRVDGRRRYYRQSLKTSNYFEAREKAKEIKTMKDPNYFINEFERLLNGLDFVGGFKTPGNLYVENRFGTPKALSKKNKYDDVSQLVMFRELVAQQKETNAKAAKLLERFETVWPAIETFLKNGAAPVVKPITPRTISEVLEAWIFNGQNCAKEQGRKRAAISKLIGEVGLTLKDDYSKFHNPDMIDQIYKNVVARADIQNTYKRKYMCYVKNFGDFAIERYQEDYKVKMPSIPKIKPTKKSELKPHEAYTDDQLNDMFDPTHDFFENNPDMFFTCLIGLFTGARVNAAATLQYKDIKTVEDIECVEFVGDHDTKTLKTEASERIVPIHNQLLDVGFLDYVRRKQARIGASANDFIFDRSITSGGVYYKYYQAKSIKQKILRGCAE